MDRQDSNYKLHKAQEDGTVSLLDIPTSSGLGLSQVPTDQLIGPIKVLYILHDTAANKQNARNVVFI